MAASGLVACSVLSADAPVGAPPEGNAKEITRRPRRLTTTVSSNDAVRGDRHLARGLIAACRHQQRSCALDAVCHCASDWWRMPHTDRSASSTVPLLIVQWARLIAHRIDALSDFLGRELLGRLRVFRNPDIHERDIHERSSGNSANEHTAVEDGELMGLHTPRGANFRADRAGGRRRRAPRRPLVQQRCREIPRNA